MAHIEVGAESLWLRLGRWERVAALTGDVEVPLADVTAVEEVREARRYVHGMRLGTGVPGVLVAGRFFGGEGEAVAFCRGRQPGVVLDLRTLSPGRVVVTVDDPAATVARIRAALG